MILPTNPDSSSQLTIKMFKRRAQKLEGERAHTEKTGVDYTILCYGLNVLFMPRISKEIMSL